MKNTIFAALLSALFIAILLLSDLVDTGNITFKQIDVYWAFLATIFQIFACFLTVARYNQVLKMRGIQVPIHQVGSANITSMAIGQWFPGSMVAIEAIRMGLMFGSTSNQAETFTERLKVTQVSLADRIIGQGSMLLVGFNMGFVCLLFSSDLIKHRTAFFTLMSISLLCGLVILCLPYALSIGFLRPIMRWCSEKQNAFSPAIAKANSSIVELADLIRPSRELLLTVVISILLMTFTVANFYACAKAIGIDLNFWVLMFGFPLLSLTTLIPSGLGSLGGHQFLAMGIFIVFTYLPSQIATASLFCAILSMTVTTLLGTLFGLQAMSQIRNLLSRYRVN